jgi:hypothetical protein
MTFDEILAQVLDLLQRERRLSYRALKVRFALGDDHLEALKDEIIEAKQLAVDEKGSPGVDGRFRLSSCQPSPRRQHMCRLRLSRRIWPRRS